MAKRFRRVLDEEDMAISAMYTLFDGIRADRFPDLFDRNSLWALLLTLADRRVATHIRRETAQKRGAGRVQSLSELPSDGGIRSANRHPVAECGLTPEYLTAVMDELSNRLDQLGDPVLREIALLELNGNSPAEIRERLRLGSERTYFRKRKLIHAVWEDALSDE
jgi:DNA-directed RNA polymerase specialized sigma24 family protein